MISTENYQGDDGLDILMSASGIMSYKNMYDKKLNTMYSEYSLTNGSSIIFDNVYSYWMRMLYLLVFHISKEREDRKITIPIMHEKPLYQFFGLAESACDQLMYLLVKDELSGCENNKYLDCLSYHLLFGSGHETVFVEDESLDQPVELKIVKGTDLDSKIEEGDRNIAQESTDILLETTEENVLDSSTIRFHVNEIKLTQMKKYLKGIICDEFNGLVQGAFYDFYISFWSGFEATINLICKPYEDAIQKELEESSFKDMRKLLKKLISEDEAAVDNEGSPVETLLCSLDNHKEDFLKSFGPYVSLSDKYNYLLKKVIGDKNYTRNRKRDTEILNFGGSMRNTMHNNGVHLKASKSLDINGYEYHLVQNEKRYSDDFADLFLFCEELFDIYLAIVNGMEMVSEN